MCCWLCVGVWCCHALRAFVVVVVVDGVICGLCLVWLLVFVVVCCVLLFVVVVVVCCCCELCDVR